MKKSQTPHHCDLPYFPVKAGQLLVGGLPIEQLARQVGSTPFYAYDRKVIDQRIQALRTILPGPIKLHYAVKANPMPALVQHVATQVDGLDIASQGELHIAETAKMSAHNISFTGPGKSIEELRMALRANIIINIESETEMDRIAQLGNEFNIRPTVTVRINPDFELKSSGLRMGGGPQQFGIDAEKAPALLNKLKSLDLELTGFHIFSGSQNLDENAIIKSQAETVRLAIQLAKHTPSGIKTLNLGGGFGIPYFPGEKPLKIHNIAKNLAHLHSKITTEIPGVELVLELGRYLVGEAGIYVCRISDIKESRGRIFAITDGGLHQHLAATGNFGQIIRKNYPVVIGNKMDCKKEEKISIVGRLCTPLDLLANEINLPKTEIGDLVAILQSGAYGRSASPQEFLSHPHIKEVLI